MTMADESSLTAGISPLDEAHALRHGGDAEGALRIAIALLEAEPLQLGAATLAAQILADEGRPIVAGEAAARLVSAYVRRGALPEGVVAAKVVEKAGEDAAAGLKELAEAFGKGSVRLADVSPAPPPLPKEVKITPALKRLSRDPLRERAEDALSKLLAADDPAPEDAKVPRLPLFAALEPKALSKLLAAVTVRDVPQGEAVTTQGDEGRDAWVVVRGMVKAVRASEGGGEVVLAALGPGAIVGEMALVSDAPRAASVIAVEPVRLLVLSREALEKLAGSEPAIGRELGAFCRARMVSNLVRHSAILSAVDERERKDLIGRFQTRTFEPGEALIREGAETEGLFLIASGSVEVSGKDADGDRLRIAELGPGDVVGEISLVLRRPAMADVKATHPTVTLELTREEFQKAIKDHPTLLNELYELATKREEETRTVVAQEALDVGDVVLV
jgi:cAMP-dependent protein kinase regulator